MNRKPHWKNHENPESSNPLKTPELGTNANVVERKKLYQVALTRALSDQSRPMFLVLQALQAQTTFVTPGHLEGDTRKKHGGGPFAPALKTCLLVYRSEERKITIGSSIEILIFYWFSLEIFVFYWFLYWNLSILLIFYWNLSILIDFLLKS